MAAAALAAFGLQAAGTTYSAVSQYYQAKWAKQLGEYNAKVSEMQAGFAVQRGESMAKRQRMQTELMIGAQRASYAAQNVSVDDGIALEVQADTAYWGEIDALTIRNNAALEAWGYKQSALNSRIQGQMAYAKGISDSVGTILGGAGKIASGYASYSG